MEHAQSYVAYFGEDCGDHHSTASYHSISIQPGNAQLHASILRGLLNHCQQCLNLPAVLLGDFTSHLLQMICIQWDLEGHTLASAACKVANNIEFPCNAQPLTLFSLDTIVSPSSWRRTKAHPNLLDLRLWTPDTRCLARPCLLQLHR